MSDGGTLAIPPIVDTDVSWSCHILGLPATAFVGADGHDPRQNILKSLDTMDVEACPGSGKTTLLVAKLAILARAWTDPRKGVCVLSHTNVARKEIEARLGNTTEGRRLLSYPHFIGTIHGFVNEFLATPWLRSLGLPIRTIDDEAALQRRWRKLPFKIRSGLEKCGHDYDVLRLASVEYSLGDVRWGKGSLSEASDTYQAMRKACKESCEEGYFCYGEMFLWATHLLSAVEGVRDSLRVRFPLLFLDEVQDNSEEQSSLLFQVFMEGPSPVRRQRFGDANQAIFQIAGQSKGADTDVFSDAAIRRDVPNSCRFGKEIAKIADPLALVPQSLQGDGPSASLISADTSGKHAIFLFDDGTIPRVLDSYCSYLREVFSEDDLRKGTFTAVGAVHRPGGADKVPRSVGHYWSDYDHELTSADPRPTTFLQYAAAGRAAGEQSGATHIAVEKIADGVLRLCRIVDPLATIVVRQRRHRQVLELLTGKDAVRAEYLDLVMTIGVDGETPTQQQWQNKWSALVLRVAEAIARRAAEPESRTAIDTFLTYVQLKAEGLPKRDNIFRFPASDPALKVRVGSIHSVKGETHTATLVLETFYRKYHLFTLKPWLLRAKSGGHQETSETCSRLRLHYVAMTRPTHLLCLAMRSNSFSSEELAKAKDVGWRVGKVTDKSTEWM